VLCQIARPALSALAAQFKLCNDSEDFQNEETSSKDFHEMSTLFESYVYKERSPLSNSTENESVNRATTPNGHEAEETVMVPNNQVNQAVTITIYALLAKSAIVLQYLKTIED
jgi:hypothetical protein